MRKIIVKNATSIRVNESYEGESIEEKIEKMLANNEPLESISPMIYTERKDGVLPEYDIRTDRFEIAREAMTKVSGAEIAKRDAKVPEGGAEEGAGEGTGKASSESTEGTE